MLYRYPMVFGAFTYPIGGGLYNDNGSFNIVVDNKLEAIIELTS
jgi:hypothetical protein